MKIKNVIKRGISILMLCALISPIVSHAAGTQNSNNETGGVNAGGGGDASIEQQGEVFDDRMQGLRVYVVNQDGVLVDNIYGTQAIDFYYNTGMSSESSLKSFYRSDFNKYYSGTKKRFNDIVYAAGAGENNCLIRVGGQSATTTRKSIIDMGLAFNVTIDSKEMIRHYPTLAYHTIEILNDAGNYVYARHNGKRGVTWHLEDEIAIERGDATGDGYDDMGMVWLACDFWGSDIVTQGFKEKGYTLCVEQIFCLKLLNSSNNLTGDVFYGSVYELGLYGKQRNLSQVGAVGDYGCRYIPASLAIDYTPSPEIDGEMCIKDTTNLVAPDKTRLKEIRESSGRRYLTFNEMIKYGYGINMYHDQFPGIEPSIDPQPPQEDITPSLQQEVTQVFTPLVDDDEGLIECIDAYTGYRAQDGKYDISTSYGIPTTEFLTNEIYTQDRVVQLTFGSEAWVPEEFPQITYKLTYKVPYKYWFTAYHDCDCDLYDSTGKYVGCQDDHSYQDYEIRYRDETSVVGKSEPIIRIGQYFYVSDYAIYALESVDVQNTASDAYYSTDMSDLTRGDIKIICSGVEFPGIINGSDVNEHIDFSDVIKWNGYVADNNAIGHGTFSSRSEAEAWVASQGTAWAENTVGYPIVKNDHVEIDGVVYLDSVEYTGKENTKPVYNPENGLTSIVTITPEPVDPIMDYKITHQVQEDLYIDAEIPNGKYYTSMDVRYKRLRATNEHPYYLKFSWAASDSDKSHIITNKVLQDVSMIDLITLKNGRQTNYRAQEPIRIITPVISPTTLRYDEDKNPTTGVQNKVSSSLADNSLTTEEEKLLHGTQLINEADAQQLRLDETYTITFDTTEHFIYTNAGYYNVANDLLLGYGDAAVNNNDSTWFANGVFAQNPGFESNSKYDKYVRNKQVKFPFDTYIDGILFKANEWITLYSYDPTTKVATAGDTKENHLQNFVFYIPSWAEETKVNHTYDAHGNITNTTSNDFIEIRVEAVNANSTKEYEEWNGGDIYNTDNDTCVATYRINVQLSGWVYDFKIVSSTPALPWTGPEADEDITTMYADLAGIHDEFFAGVYNRTGNDSIYNSNDTETKDRLHRYYDDGKVEEISERKDTTPLNQGSSELYPRMGELVRDSNIYFTLSTMSNLDRDDKIVIKPTFTWYSKDLSEKLENDEFILHYNNNVETPPQLFIPYDSDRDKEYTPSYLNTQLNSFGLRTSINKDNVAYLTQNYGYVWDSNFMNPDLIDIGYFGELTLEAKELMMYNTKALKELKINQGRDADNLINILDEHDGYESGNLSLTDQTNKLTESAQIWYGEYDIPKTLRLVKKSDLAAHGVDSLYDYAVKQGGITDNDEIFVQDGYLILNFDITVYKNGEPYLTYEHGTSDQWQRQGQRDTANIDLGRKTSDKLVKILSKNPNKKLDDAVYESLEKVSIKSGDIAVIDLGEVNDKWYSRLVFTN